MNQIENKQLEDICHKIQMNIGQIKKAVEGIPLFGAVGGSISFNLANKSSDIDFYMAVKMEPFRENAVKNKKIHLSDITVDFMCVPIDELVHECKKNCIAERRYPTIFYRSKEEEDAVKLNKDVERPDFKREMVGRIYLADKILEFEPGAVYENYKELKNGCRLIDIWDSYFNRAYGNYHEKIKGRDRILLRKYLYVISEITICRLLTERNEKPVMDFKKMFAFPYCVYEDSEIIKICNELWEENRKTDADKEKKYISKILYINRWIEFQLEELVMEMQKKEKVLKNTYLSYGQVICPG